MVCAAPLRLAEALGSTKVAKPTNMAARPTMLCIRATSSGICVICTVRAAYKPTLPPTSIAPTIQGIPASVTVGPNTVASTASAMPTMPYRLPRRAVSWLERPPRLRMNKMVAPM